MKVKYSDIQQAYTIANAGKYDDRTALLDKSSGQFYVESESSNDAVIADEVFTSDTMVPLPDKKGFDLGSPLVFRFIRETHPEGYDKVSEIFTRRGAYGRYKKWLIANNLLARWEDYLNAAETKALRGWCADNGIELED